MPFISSNVGNFSSIGISTGPWNMVGGGSILEVSNYNGTGQRWRIHSFTSTQNINILKSNNQDWKILFHGNGGRGGPDGGAGGGGAGSFEGTLTSAQMPYGTYSLTIGAFNQNCTFTIGGTTLTVQPGVSAPGAKTGGLSGGSTSGTISGLTARNGGTSGGYTGAGLTPGSGSGGFISNITGTSLGYCGGGGAGGHSTGIPLMPGGSGSNGGGNGGAGGSGSNQTGEAGAGGNRGGGGGGSGVYNYNQVSGGTGTLIIAYRIG